VLPGGYTRDINHHLSSTSVIIIRRYSHDFYCQNDECRVELPESVHLEALRDPKLSAQKLRRFLVRNMQVTTQAKPKIVR
jgi:hypothetical protein